jgi:phosphonate transport system substrate-binding protein
MSIQMLPPSDMVLGRRSAVTAGLAALACGRRVGAAEPIRFGLTPVFVDSDLQLLALLHDYLVAAIGAPVELVHRRTYQEITALLLSDQIDAAWICGFPYVRWRDRLSLVAVPVYLGRPLYQSYVIVGRDRAVAGFEDLKGDVHAFSDPDSNSGWLVTRHLLLERGASPASFFSRTFFTYGHRNVVRAVAAGLAQSGSVDGYVWNVLAEREPALTGGTRILRRSEWLGFPPVATTATRHDTPEVRAIANALLTMPATQQGRALLKMLELDGFAPGEPALFDPIDRMYRAVEAAS